MSRSRTTSPATPANGTAHGAAHAAHGVPVAAPRVVGQRRVRAGHLGLAFALIAAGGLLAGFAFYSATRTGDYLAVAKPVAAGAELRSGDLATVQINNAAGLTPIPADEIDRVIGQRAKVSLVPGTLLTDDQLTDTALVGPGQRQIGVGLKPEKMPARRLNPGDKMQLVAIPDPNRSGTGTDPTDPTSGAETPRSSPLERFDATVVDSSPPTTTDNTTVLYLAVADADAPRILALASANQLGVVLAGAR